MRKPFLLASFALFTTLGAFPMKEIAGEFQPWDANCQILGNNIAFMTEWNGVTFKFFDKDGCVFEGGTDFSEYDMLVLKLKDASCMFKIKTEYTDGTTQQDSWGAERAITPGLLVAGIDLNPEHKKNVKDFFLQSADYPGMITIDKVIACTKAEYEQMLKEEKAKRFDLTLKKVNEGGGADYDPATKTISIKDDWAHKGWYFNDQFRDFSLFDMFVIQFAQPTATEGEIGIEYDGEGAQTTTSKFEAGASQINVPLSKDKNKLRQVYVKGPSGATFVLKGARFATNGEVTPIKRIDNEKASTDTQTRYYSLDGRELKEPAKGLHIEKKNGRAQTVIRR